MSSISSEIINQGPTISDEDFSFLSSNIKDEEIKDALFHIGDGKLQVLMVLQLHSSIIIGM